jgi:transcriptional regulator with PAS, ATPase and Fis domain
MENSTMQLPNLDQWYASNAMMRQLDEEITRVAQSNHPVLITGESGSGKTTIAHLIHQRSPRARGNLVDINCAALPEALIESELFGFERGAFTSATGDKRGLFQVAEKGTLFLDEIGELKLELQAKLLKAIEQQTIRRLGGTRDIQCNVRVVAASSRNLQRMVKHGTFREDLYYRLAVFELEVPPLRERSDDVKQLVDRQLAVERTKLGMTELLPIDERAMKELCEYSWPGNIRQLNNVIIRLANTSGCRAISTAQVRSELRRFRTLEPDTIILPDSCTTLLSGESLREFLLRIRKAVIESVRHHVNNSMTDAARRLAVDRTALHKMVHRLNS